MWVFPISVYQKARRWQRQFWMHDLDVGVRPAHCEGAPNSPCCSPRAQSRAGRCGARIELQTNMIPDHCAMIPRPSLVTLVLSGTYQPARSARPDRAGTLNPFPPPESANPSTHGALSHTHRPGKLGDLRTFPRRSTQAQRGPDIQSKQAPIAVLHARCPIPTSLITTTPPCSQRRVGEDAEKCGVEIEMIRSIKGCDFVKG